MTTLDFLMPRGMQRVLAPLLLHPERSYSLSDLIRAAGGGRGGTQKIVEALSKSGVVTERRAGNQRLFTADTSHPIYPELRSLSLKTFGLADRLREALEPVRDRIETAFVFGSMASGAANGKSDIDLLVVGDLDFFEVSALLAEAGKELGREIHVNLVDAAEWSAWKQGAVGDAILRGPTITVIGDGR